MVSFGLDTSEKALQELAKAKEAWLETARIENIIIPSPRYRPAIYHVPS